MSAHGEESNEGKYTTIAKIITNLEYILKEHCEKIKLIESHLVFMKEQIDQQQETKKEFQQLD